jgi:hypothetical protein
MLAVCTDAQYLVPYATVSHPRSLPGNYQAMSLDKMTSLLVGQIVLGKTKTYVVATMLGCPTPPYQITRVVAKQSSGQILDSAPFTAPLKPSSFWRS